jgi:predicted HTH transcriptional regulator
MKVCEQCGKTIQDGEEREKDGRTLCEDCYIDLISSPRACDPWAVYSAKKASGSAEITEQQAAILAYLKETGGATLEEISEKLDIRPADLEREFAVLRHMERVKGRLENGEKLICLW